MNTEASRVRRFLNFVLLTSASEINIFIPYTVTATRAIINTQAIIEAILIPEGTCLSE